jgi:putative phage-type endonuclease
MPKIIDGLEQAGEAWHKFRLAHIGSSDVPEILLLDPFSGPMQDFQLYLEKSQSKAAAKKNTEHTAHGKDHEDEARMSYAAETGNIVLPCVVECDVAGYEYLAASLDGASEDLSLITEIKCPIEAGTFRHAKEGQIEPSYYAQMQHQMFVTGAQRCDYYCWFAGEGILIPVARDEGFIKDMLVAVKEFWRRVQTKTWPMPEGEVRFVSQEEADKYDKLVQTGGKVDFAYTVATEAFLTWAADMARYIEMTRELDGIVAAHKARGRREFFGDAKKIVGGGLDIGQVYKKSYPMNFVVPEQIQLIIRRTE